MDFQVGGESRSFDQVICSSLLQVSTNDTAFFVSYAAWLILTVCCSSSKIPKATWKPQKNPVTSRVLCLFQVSGFGV